MTCLLPCHPGRQPKQGSRASPMRALIRLALALLLCGGNARAATYDRYLSSSLAAGTSGDGSAMDGSHAWQNTAQAQQFYDAVVTSGDVLNLYVRAGDTFYWGANDANVPLVFDKVGVQVNLAPQGSGAKPVFDGRYTSSGAPARTDAAFISVRDGGFSIRGFEIRYGYRHGIDLQTDTGDATVTGCTFYRNGSSGVTTINGTNRSIAVVGCWFEDQPWRLFLEGVPTTGGWVQAGVNCNGSTIHGTIVQRYNVYRNSNAEATGVGDNGTVEFCVMEDFRTVGAYVEQGRGIVRYNLILMTPSGRTTWPSARGVELNQEDQQADIDDSEVYGNLIVHCASGIRMKNAATSGDPATITGVKVYQNTLVDNDYGMSATAAFATYVSPVIVGNLTATYGGGAMANISTPPAGTDGLGHNFWTAPPDGIFATEGTAVVGAADLGKTSGWDAVTAYADLSLADFVPGDEARGSAPALDADYVDEFLTADTSGFGEIPDEYVAPNFVLAAQTDPWTFGAALPSAGGGQAGAGAAGGPAATGGMGGGGAAEGTAGEPPTSTDGADESGGCGCRLAGRCPAGHRHGLPAALALACLRLRRRQRSPRLPGRAHLRHVPANVGGIPGADDQCTPLRHGALPSVRPGEPGCRTGRSIEAA